MSPPTDRAEILEGFRKQIKDGKPIVGAGAGTFAVGYQLLMLSLKVIVAFMFTGASMLDPRSCQLLLWARLSASRAI